MKIIGRSSRKMRMSSRAGQIRTTLNEERRYYSTAPAARLYVGTVRITV